MLERPVQARVALAIPYVGHLFMALGTETARMALFVAPAVLIALWMLAGAWRDAGRLVQREQA